MLLIVITLYVLWHTHNILRYYCVFFPHNTQHFCVVFTNIYSTMAILTIVRVFSCSVSNIQCSIVFFSQYSQYFCFLFTIFMVCLILWQTDEECCNIALRTRSKLPLNDTPLDVIESSFIAPDITADLYDEPFSVACDDDDWKSFLSGLFKQG